MRAMMAIPPPNPIVPILRNVSARAARESCCLSGSGWLTPVTITHPWSERRSWHSAPGRLDREGFQVEDIEAVYIQIDHEIWRPHGAHRKYVGRLRNNDVGHLQEYQSPHRASSHA